MCKRRSHRGQKGSRTLRVGNQSAFSWSLFTTLCSTIQVPQPEAKRCPLKKVAQGFIKLICHGMFICCALSELPAQVVVLPFGFMIKSIKKLWPHGITRLGNRNLHSPSMDAACLSSIAA